MKQIVILALFILHLVEVCSAHGSLCWPYMRVSSGDIGRGWSDALRRTNDLPTSPICHGNPKGSILTPAIRGGQPVTISYILTVSHGGNCSFLFQRSGSTTWDFLGSDPTCGERGLGSYTTPYWDSFAVTLPQGSYSGILRFAYNARLTGEVFDGCADILVSPGGSNSYPSDSCKRLDTNQRPQYTNYNTPCIEKASTCIANRSVLQRCYQQQWYPVDCPSGTECTILGQDRAACR
ncbi:hypothetical protein BJ741DRAFT_703096 [Chytriomyces cf. hyalinus JEL632]|nr:hypothetical protein BJ741DRAFT_703096 [Chytriomyces cf. hyalinus JEL632]